MFHVSQTPISISGRETLREGKFRKNVNDKSPTDADVEEFDKPDEAELPTPWTPALKPTFQRNRFEVPRTSQQTEEDL